MNFQRFLSIVKKEFIQIKRDKASLVIAVMMPIVMMVLFGYAVNTELEHIPTAVVDNSATTESKDLVKKYEDSDYFSIDKSYTSEEDIVKDIDKGKIHAGLIIPKDYADKLKKGEKPEIKLLIDGSEPTTARTALNSGVVIAQKANAKIVEQKMSAIPQKLKAQAQGIGITTKVLYNEDLKSRNFTIPGLIGLIMQNITILLTAFALVREKERGTIEQLVVSPLRSSEIILGKMIPYILIGSIDFLISIALGIYWFSVPINGSLGLLLILGFGFVICALAIGILISTAAKTQMEAMQMSFMVLLPSILLSGFVFPREAMPKIIQLIGNVIPLTYFLNILRGIIVKGIGMEYLYKDVVILFIIGVILLVLSMVQFRRKLE